MKHHLLACVALGCLALAGCGKKSEVTPTLDAATAAAPAAESTSSSTGPALALPQLAYRFSYVLSTPPDRIKTLMGRHEKACVEAGPSVCQLVDQSFTDRGRDEISGRLKLRAAPAWLTTFRGGLDTDAKAAGGKLESSAVDSEDLTAQMIDAEAAISAKRALRDRLQTLVATHPGKLPDLLEIENQLARVQAEIDAAQSGLAVMRARVAMSELTVEYGSRQPFGASLARSARDSAALSAGLLSGILKLLIVLGPICAPPALIVWLIARRQRRAIKAAA